jgi:TP901 family phage tail tape measure protein
MAGSQGAITKELTAAVSGAGGATAQAGDAAGLSLGSSLLSKVKSVLGPAAVATAVVGVGKGLYSLGKTFDEVTDTIRTGTGATGDALDGLVAVAKNVGSEVPAEWSEIGSTVADLNTRLGLSGDTLQTVSEQYLEAGRILGESVDVNKTTAAFSAFQIKGKDVEGAMDSLFQTSQATGVGMNELADAVTSNAPAMQALGFNFQETAALAGSLDKAGLDSTKTMAAMSKGLVTMAKDGEQPEEAFQRITSQIGDLIEKGDTASAIDLASGIFGTRGATQFVGAVQNGSLALDDLVGSIGASGDTILGVGDDTADFAEKWQLVKNNAQLALEPLASTVFDTLGQALGKLVEPMQSVSAWFQENPAAVEVLAGVLGGVLLVALAGVTAAMWGFVAATLANPVTWIIVGIMALVAAIVALATNWDTVVAWVKETGALFLDWWNGIWDSAGAWVSQTWDNITGWVSEKWNGLIVGIQGLGAMFTAWWNGLWEGVGTFLSTKWDEIVAWVTGIPDRFLAGLAALGQLGAKLGGYVQQGNDAMTAKFNEVVSWVGGIPGRILNGLGNLGSLLWNAGTQIIEGFWNGLKSKFESVKNWVGGIGTWISEHKGPKAYDLALLVPNGGWIMQGLGTGLEREFQNVLGDVGSMGARLQAELSGSVIPAASVAPYVPAGNTASALPAVYVENPWTGDQVRATVRDQAVRVIKGRY